MLEVLGYEQNYTARANRFSVILLLCHMPFLAGVAAYYDTGVPLAIVGSLLLVLGPSLLYWLARSSNLTSIAVAVSGMTLSALLIHLGRGTIEMHFHVFIFIAFLIVFGRAWPILAAAAVIAVHHLAFWVFLPASVFDHTATFGTVALHAFFVVAEVLPAIYIAQRLGKAIRSEGVINGQLYEVSEHILATASQVRENGSSLSQDTKSQAVILEQTSTASENISSKINSTARKSKTMSSLMAETETAILGTSQEISSLISQMGEIDEANEAVVKIIKVIDGVAFQTNILALNAAVEAARAGEAGLGFSVVADEVRKLAQNCADAAQQTSQLIHNSTVKTKQGNAQLEGVSRLIVDLTGASSKVKQLIEEVSQENSEQADHLHQVSSALSSLREITNRNAASAEENAAASEELQAQATTMQNIVEQLSISEAPERS